MATTLPGALRDWNSDAFPATLRAELLTLGKEGLPLHQATRQGGYVDDGTLEITLLGSREGDGVLEVRVGIFFTEIVINCGCGADPMPVHAYCALSIRIDRSTGAAIFTVLPD